MNTIKTRSLSLTVLMTWTPDIAPELYRRLHHQVHIWKMSQKRTFILSIDNAQFISVGPKQMIEAGVVREQWCRRICCQPEYPRNKQSMVPYRHFLRWQPGRSEQAS